MNTKPIPLPWEMFNFCPKCGSQAIKRAESNAIKCVDCGYHHFFNAAGAVIALIRNEAGELLITERAFEPFKGMLDLPGGFIMPDETAEEAVRRELFEELGVELEEMHYLYTRSNRYPFSDVIVFTMDLVFDVKVKDLSVIKAGDDVKSLTFMNKSDLELKQFGIDSVRDVVRRYLKKDE